MMAKRSRHSEEAKIYWFGAIRTCLIYGVVTLVTGLIVLKIALYIPVFSSWPHNTLIIGCAGKTLLLLSLLLVLTEIVVTRHPFYEIWRLATLGGIIVILTC